MKPFHLDSDYKGNMIQGAITVSDHYDCLYLPAETPVTYEKPTSGNIFIFECPEVFWASFRDDVPAKLPQPVSILEGQASVPNPYVRKIPKSCAKMSFVSEKETWLSIAVFG